MFSASSVSSLRRVGPVLRFFSRLLKGLGFHGVLGQKGRSTTILLGRRRVVSVGSVQLVSLSRTKIVSLSVVNHDVFLRRRERLIIRRRFPRFPIKIVARGASIGKTRGTRIVSKYKCRGDVLTNQVRAQESGREYNYQLFHLFRRTIGSPFRLLLVCELRRMIRDYPAGDVGRMLVVDYVRRGLRVPDSYPP